MKSRLYESAQKLKETDDRRRELIEKSMIAYINNKLHNAGGIALTRGILKALDKMLSSPANIVKYKRLLNKIFEEDLFAKELQSSLSAADYQQMVQIHEDIVQSDEDDQEGVIDELFDKLSKIGIKDDRASNVLDIFTKYPFPKLEQFKQELSKINISEESIAKLAGLYQ